MRYSREFIDELLQSVSLYQLMSDYGVTVKSGHGKNDYYIASWCCGKHDYDNGRISKLRQTYKCMACGEQGNAIHFLNRYAGIGFLEAVKILAERAGMELPEVDPAAVAAAKRKEQALKLAAEFYREQANYDYLLSRGISLDVLQQVQAGYAPGGRVLRDYLESNGYTKDELKKYRLINRRGLDTFFRRAIIPQFKDGKVIDLYGRAVDSDTNYPHLYLYGDRILNGIDVLDPNKVVFLFESDIDRLVAKSMGMDNGVHPGGATKFTKAHASMLKRKGVQHVLIIFDGDEAGINGAIQAGEWLKMVGIQARIVKMPDGTDPADLLQTKGVNYFTDYLQHNTFSFDEFKLYHELDKYDISVIEKYLSIRKQSDINEGANESF